MKEIKFYRVQDTFGEFSNFAPYPIILDALLWPTTEHYFQAAKFEDEFIKEVIRSIPRAIDAAKEGRKRIYTLRPDWETVKDDVMRKALRAKFRQYHSLKKLLVETGNAMLVEHTANDAYWGDGGNGSGRNMLGILLMQEREKLISLGNPRWLLPPWIAFENIDIDDMFWRMGRGEELIREWFYW